MKRVVFLSIILVRPDIPVSTRSCARTLEDYLSAKLRDEFFQGEFDVKHLYYQGDTSTLHIKETP